MISLSSTQQITYQHRLTQDLANRSITGTFIYIFVWIVLSCNMVYKDSRESLLNWLIVCTAILIVASIFRALVISLAKSPQYSNQVKHYFLVSGAFISSLVWGVTSALSYLDTPLREHSNVMLLSTVALSAGGTITLFVSKPALNALLIGLLLPTLFVQFVLLKHPDYEICSIILIFFFGLINGSKNVCKEYSNALAQNIVLEDLSNKDQLTGLKNRRHFDERLGEEFDLALMHEHHRPLSIILIDIDHFKTVNDNYGHLAGDRCLKEVASVLKSSFDSSDHTIARYGGEEFVLLLSKINQAQCARIAEDLRVAIQLLRILSDEDVLQITASLGCYTLSNYSGSVTTENMLQCADEALYESKDNGRNQVTMYSGLESL